MTADLIAREEPLAALRLALERALAGRGGLVLVQGPPGIGKTSVVAPIANEAERAGAEVVFGRAWELAESPPWFPLWECFRSLGVERPAQEEAFRVWERVLAALAERAAKRPLVWVLDDLHAADLHTLDLLTFLARPIAAMRVLILVTARDKDPRISTRAAQRILRMARDGVDIRLDPLPPAAVAQLVERVTGKPLKPTAAVSAEALTARTEGNPLFIVECARMMRDAPASGALRTLPPNVRQLVLERTALLPDETRGVLEAGAVLGREFVSGRVAKVLDRLPAQVIEALGPALDAGIVAERRPGHFAFTHILVRDAIEDTIAPARAATLHGAAEAVLATEGDGADVRVERARHALASMQNAQEALALAEDAARILEAEGSFDRALAMYERIDEARAKGGLPARTADESLRYASLLRAVGRKPEADAACEAIANEARALGDHVQFARAALARGADLRPAVVDHKLVGLLESALASPPDARTACLLKARLAAALQPAENPQVPVAMARAAIAEARAIGDESLLLDALSWGGAALVDYAPIQERCRIGEELENRAIAAGAFPLALRAHMRVGFDRIELGDFAAWNLHVERVRALAERIGHPRSRWRALLFVSMWELAHGNNIGSERALVELRELSALTDDPAIALSVQAHRGQVVRLMHRDADMRIALREMEIEDLAVTGGREISRVLRLGMLAQMEDHAAVRELLAVSAPNAVGALEQSLNYLEPVGLGAEPGVFTLFVAQGVAVAGDEASCRRMRARLSNVEKRHVVGGHVPFTYEGPIARIEALLDARLGDHASAERLLHDAIVEMKAHGLAPWVAQLEFDLANVLALRGASDEANALFRGVIAAAEELGMPGLVMRATERASTSTSTSTSTATSTSTSTSTSTLTMSREGDVWLIAFEGRPIRVKDSRGIQLLARLVERPGEEIHVLALGSDEPGASLVETSTVPAIDAKARAAYKERLDSIALALEEAESHADRGRIEKLEREKSALERELLAAVGLGGKSRATGSASERARVNVQRRVKDAINRIAEHDAGLGKFLERAVRTGTYCRFGI